MIAINNALLIRHTQLCLYLFVGVDVALQNATAVHSVQEASQGTLEFCVELRAGELQRDVTVVLRTVNGTAVCKHHNARCTLNGVYHMILVLLT